MDTVTCCSFVCKLLPRKLGLHAIALFVCMSPTCTGCLTGAVVHPPLSSLGHIGGVMFVWRKGNINKNCFCVTVLCTIIMVHKDTSSSYRSVECIGL